MDCSLSQEISPMCSKKAQAFGVLRRSGYMWGLSLISALHQNTMIRYARCDMQSGLIPIPKRQGLPCPSEEPSIFIWYFKIEDTITMPNTEEEVNAHLFGLLFLTYKGSRSLRFQTGPLIKVSQILLNSAYCKNFSSNTHKPPTRMALSTFLPRRTTRKSIISSLEPILGKRWSRLWPRSRLYTI